MGLLDYIIQSGQATKRNIRSLLDDPSGYTNALLNRGVENTQAHLNKLTGKPYNQGNDQAYQDAMNEAALAALTVYHGSPHKFDKFDMSKIGTGDGAQAYGHGLYFAENKGVAQEYADKLDPQAAIARSNTDAQGTAARVLQSVSGDKAKAIAELQSRKEMPHVKGDVEWAKKMDDGIAWLRGDIPQQSLYKVDIPDEAIPRMLDWDKPLSEQGGVSRFASLPDFARPLDDVEASNVLGQRLHQRLSNKLGEEGARKALSDAGIPGIRYLDGGSRGAGTGTYNYVLFDDQLPRILERNGVPMGNKPWAPGEYTGLLGR